MPYKQDRPMDHWLKISPKNIEEKNTNHAEASPVAEPANWDKIEKGQKGENESVYRPWEAEGDGSIGTEMGKNSGGNEGRKPHSGEEAGKAKNPNLKKGR